MAKEKGQGIDLKGRENGEAVLVLHEHRAASEDNSGLKSGWERATGVSEEERSRTLSRLELFGH